MRSVAVVVALVACVHAAAWALVRGQATAPDFDGQLASISYAPFPPGPRPTSSDPAEEAKLRAADEAKIRADLKALAPYTRAIRLYSSTDDMRMKAPDGVDSVKPPPGSCPEPVKVVPVSPTHSTEMVPAIAAEFGLKVMVGAWVDFDEGKNAAKRCEDREDPVRRGEREAKNQREINSAIALARQYHNVIGIVVGNETVLRAEKNVSGDTPARRQELIQYQVDELKGLLDRVKRESRVPVTTGETWNIWEKYPDLASHVDFIAAHILPYWEGDVTDKQAVDRTIVHYQQLRDWFPGKRIVIAEFGWPSAGYNNKVAVPGRIQQAEVLRTFVARADTYGIDYNIVEGIDQPWKSFEGSVGAYWGVFDAARHAKFEWAGPITDSDHSRLAGLAVLLALLVSVPLLKLRRATLPQAILLAVTANVVGAWIATVFAFWKGHYFVPGAAFALGVGLALLVPLIVIAFSRVQEIAAVLFGGKPLRLVASPPLAPAPAGPKVSIHIPAYMEPPEMLTQTLDAVARLDYANFECVVVINNTPDPAYWRPIEDHCRTLGERFKFVNVESLPGFKAGALRLALVHTAADADIIGIIDADYVVHPDWLKDLVPLFADPKVGLVQAPQDHRDVGRSLMHESMNGEYAGFFDIGMVQRNELNAIITHGTMCLIRRTAMEGAGGWSSETICEDTDLGLCILEQGWTAHYTNRRYGHGLLPDTFEAFKKQRHRWAYGGLQIVKKHWRRFLPGASLLTGDQKRQFAIGWFNWLGAESLGVVVAIFNLLWVPVVAFAGIAVPDKILTIPIIAAFAISLSHFLTLYRSRVRISGPRMAIAIFAAMSVQWTVARAVGQGLVKDHLPFISTAKGGRGRKGRDFQAFWEAILGALLIAGAVTLVYTNQKEIPEINIFAAVLVVQSLPFLCAVALAALEGTRLNDFAFWHRLEARLMVLMPRRHAAAVVPAIADVPAAPAAPADKRIDAPLAE